MARPTVTHDGFLVPNAPKVLHPRMSEPDQLDFSTAANHRWGVVEGCLVTVSGTTASMTPGVAIVNGVLVSSGGGQQALVQGSSLDRFVLVTVDISGAMVLVPGEYATDPVFPDVDIDKTLLAAVYCPTASSDFLSNVIDKRRFVSKSLLTKVLPTDDLVRNLNGSGNYYRVTGDGTTVWSGSPPGDAKLYRSAPYTLKVERHLEVDGNLAVNGNITAASILATGTSTSQNLDMGATLPDASTRPRGSIFQRTDGTIHVNTPAGWLEIATLDGMLPTGTVIQSVEPKGVMELKGWVALDGQVISETKWPTLFALAAFAGIAKPGTAGERSMALPNANGRVLMGGVTPGMPGGTSDNQVTLSISQMPKHNHSISVSKAGGATPAGRVAGSGRHSHTMAKSGRHTHDLNDPGHKHNGVEGDAAGSFICAYWGGQNKLDALFNDRNHTISVEDMPWTKAAYSGITISDSAASDHDHTLSEAPDHEHTLVMNAMEEHNHTIVQSDVGLGQSIDITPAYMGVYVYIRA